MSSEIEGAAKDKKNCVSVERIMSLVGDSITLFHTPGREAFASVSVKGHWENHRIKSSGFQDCINAMCYGRFGRVPSQNTWTEARSALAGRALHASPQKEIHVRLAAHDGMIYLDLANLSWEMVRITSTGWEVVQHAPVKFLRVAGMQPLTSPVDGGSLDHLRSCLNFHGEDDFTLAVSWLIGALRPGSQYPPLILEGSHGSAKSTASRLLRALIDPNTAPLRGEPQSVRDLAISAKNSWCLGFDNLSFVSTSVSDALCRLSTGGGFSTRALYTDGDEVIYEGTRPVILNGIDLNIERADLLDRAIVLALAPIAEEDRKTDVEVLKRFETARPFILGCLLDAVSCALSRISTTRLARNPRMADFATWVYAAEPALGWPEGTFLKAYERNLTHVNSVALDASPLVKPLSRIANEGPWEGTVTELLAKISNDFCNFLSGQQQARIPTPRQLSSDIRRLAPGLEKLGMKIDFHRSNGSNSERLVTISNVGDGATMETGSTPGDPP